MAWVVYSGLVGRDGVYWLEKRACLVIRYQKKKNKLKTKKKDQVSCKTLLISTLFEKSAMPSKKEV